MRSSSPFPALAMAAATAAFTVALIFLSPATVFADESISASRILPDASPTRLPLDEHDEIAALDAISVALGQVGDGSSYVWHRSHARLSGVVTPTSSFKDMVSGQPCRHFVTIMISGGHSRRLETIACRMPNGRWQLDG